VFFLFFFNSRLPDSPHSSITFTNRESYSSKVNKNNYNKFFNSSNKFSGMNSVPKKTRPEKTYMARKNGQKINKV